MTTFFFQCYSAWTTDIHMPIGRQMPTLKSQNVHMYMGNWQSAPVFVAATRVLNSIALRMVVWIGHYIHQMCSIEYGLLGLCCCCTSSVNRKWWCAVYRCGNRSVCGVYSDKKIRSSCISNLSCAWAIRKKCCLTNSPPYLLKSNSTYNSWLIRQQLHTVILFF